jgi:hypothetical protein
MKNFNIIIICVLFFVTMIISNVQNLNTKAPVISLKTIFSTPVAIAEGPPDYPYRCYYGFTCGFGYELICESEFVCSEWRVFECYYPDWCAEPNYIVYQCK